MRRMIFAAVLSVLAAPAAAQGLMFESPILSPQTYIPVLNHYLARLPDIRATMKACFAEHVADTEPEEWEKARAAITATLWAANFPADVAQSPERLMHPDAKGVAGACDQVGLSHDAQSAAIDGWVRFVGFSFRPLGIKIIENPPTAESLAEVETILAEETALTARLVACASVTAPGSLTFAATDWSERLVRALAKLADAGYPRPALVALAEAGNPDAFLVAANTDETLASCRNDPAWYDRLARFNLAGLTRRIDDLLERTGAVVQ